MATTAAISVEEYLNNPRYGLCEYRDGAIQEKYPVVEGVPMVSNEHGILVSLVIAWFSQHKREWGVRPVTEVHTRIAETAYRLPDVSILPLGPFDAIQVTPPLIVIEVLSPANSMSDMLRKLEDYEYMRIPNIWIIDPKTRSGRLCRGREMTQTKRFTVAGMPVYLDVDALFAEFDSDQAPSE